MKTYTALRPGSDRWFPPAPFHWTDAPVWTMFTREARKGYPNETLLSVYRDHGVVPKDSRDDNNNRPSEDLSSYQLVEPGDLVVNKMKAWQGSLSISRFRGIVSPAYFVYRPHHRADERFLHHLLRSRPLIAAYVGMSKGVRINQWDLEPQNFSRLKLALPPLEEQRAIADYLERETARIDTLIAEQQHLIEMLRERRRAVLSEAFKSGSASKTTRVGRLLAARPSYGVLVPKYVDPAEGAPFVRVGDLMNLAPGRQMLAIAREQSDEYSRTKLVGGEVLLGVVGKMGQAALAPPWLAGANVARAVAVLRCVDPATAPLLCAWLGSDQFLHQAELATSGDSIQPTLGMKDLARFDISLPTDRKTGAHLANRLAKIDTTIGETEQFIELSKERRSALITAAVTGQIDVREVA